MRQTASGPESPGQHEALRNVLDAATTIVGELAGDPLFIRLVAVFARMPADDRRPLLGILEREVNARLLTHAADAISGIRLYPNPSARLYARVVDQEASLNRQEAVLASVRAIRTFHRGVASAPGAWAAILREALRELEQEERESIANAARVLLAQVERCRGEEPGGR